MEDNRMVYIHAIETGFQLYDSVETEMTILARIDTINIDISREGDTLRVKADYPSKELEAEITITKEEILDRVLSKEISAKEAIINLLKDKISRATKEIE